MEIEFIKMQLSGRDVVLVDAARNADLDPRALGPAAATALDRRCGVGGDVLLLVSRASDGDIEAQPFVARGSPEEAGLNELMCAARYAIDAGIASGTTAVIRGHHRSVTLEALDSRSILADVAAPMREDGTELVESPDVAYTRTVRLDERDFTFTPLRVGPRHAVAFVPSFDIDMRHVARHLRPELPDGEEPGFCDPAQLTYARVISRRRLLARTWRFGHGETRSEGYAAAAAAVAAALHGFADRDTIVAARGGDLYVYWSETNNHLYVTGTPEYVFTGTYSTNERRGGG